jgi:hypothetical protein
MLRKKDTESGFNIAQDSLGIKPSQAQKKERNRCHLSADSQYKQTKACFEVV